MATDKPRFTISMAEDLYSKVDHFRYQKRISTQSKAIVELVKMGLSDLAESTEIGEKNAPSISDEAIRLARDYDGLDHWGKQALRELADTELARMEDESRFLSDAETESDPKIIPLYLSPAAAGFASPIFGEEYEPYDLQPNDPQGADFAVRLQGDSMEPHFPNGSTVFCNHDPLADGDIGVFSVDGESVCKQYHHDRIMGITYLFSLNRKRADADVVLTSGGGRTLVCLGRVITKKRLALPGD